MRRIIRTIVIQWENTRCVQCGQRQSVQEEKQINVKDLGKKLFLDSGTLTPVLKSLEAKGYVLRRRSEKDERVLNVEITQKGEALKDKAAEIPQKVSGCVKLDSDEAISLYTLLYKVLGALSEK